MGGAGFEPAKAEPTDLQSVPFDRFGNPPKGEPVNLLKLLPRNSLAKQKSQRRESNPRPADYKSAALPTELRWPNSEGT